MTSAQPEKIKRRDAISDVALAVYRRIYPGIFMDYQNEIYGRQKTGQKIDAFRSAGAYSRGLDDGAEITKEDIFFYVYGVLHSPEYRRRFAINLKKELPRIPFAKDFLAFSLTGRKLTRLHVDYENCPCYPLVEQYSSGDPQLRINPGRVVKMKWGKDKESIIYNENLTLCGVPARACDYVLNGRSALDWILLMYQVKTDKTTGIVNDPNLFCNDPRYIITLLKQITYISMETIKLMEALPTLEEITPPPDVMPSEWQEGKAWKEWM